MNPRMTRAGGIGVRTPLIDGYDKVTGRAKYTADIAVPGALVGRILRSPDRRFYLQLIEPEPGILGDIVLCPAFAAPQHKRRATPAEPPPHVRTTTCHILRRDSGGCGCLRGR